MYTLVLSADKQLYAECEVLFIHLRRHSQCCQLLLLLLSLYVFRKMNRLCLMELYKLLKLYSCYNCHTVTLNVAFNVVFTNNIVAHTCNTLLYS